MQEFVAADGFSFIRKRDVSNEPRDARGRFATGAPGSLDPDAEAHRFEHETTPMYVGDEHRKPLRAMGREVLNSLYRAAGRSPHRRPGHLNRFEDALPTKGGGVEISATHQLGSGSHLRTYARLEPSHISAVAARGVLPAVTVPAAAALAFAHQGLVQSGRPYAAHKPLPIGFTIRPGVAPGRRSSAAEARRVGQ